MYPRPLDDPSYETGQSSQDQRAPSKKSRGARRQSGRSGSSGVSRVGIPNFVRVRPDHVPPPSFSTDGSPSPPASVKSAVRVSPGSRPFDQAQAGQSWSMMADTSPVEERGRPGQASRAHSRHRRSGSHERLRPDAPLRRRSDTTTDIAGPISHGFPPSRDTRAHLAGPEDGRHPQSNPSFSQPPASSMIVAYRRPTGLSQERSPISDENRVHRIEQTMTGVMGTSYRRPQIHFPPDEYRRPSGEHTNFIQSQTGPCRFDATRLSPPSPHTQPYLSSLGDDHSPRYSPASGARYSPRHSPTTGNQLESHFPTTRVDSRPFAVSGGNSGATSPSDTGYGLSVPRGPSDGMLGRRSLDETRRHRAPSDSRGNPPSLAYRPIVSSPPEPSGRHLYPAGQGHRIRSNSASEVKVQIEDTDLQEDIPLLPGTRVTTPSGGGIRRRRDGSAHMKSTEDEEVIIQVRNRSLPRTDGNMITRGGQLTRHRSGRSGRSSSRLGTRSLIVEDERNDEDEYQRGRKRPGRKQKWSTERTVYVIPVPNTAEQSGSGQTTTHQYDYAKEESPDSTKVQIGRR